jgi:hypothetical protein
MLLAPAAALPALLPIPVVPVLMPVVFVDVPVVSPVDVDPLPAAA